MTNPDFGNLLKSSELPFFGDEKWGSWSPWLKDPFVLVILVVKIKDNGTL